MGGSKKNVFNEISHPHIDTSRLLTFGSDNSLASQGARFSTDIFKNLATLNFKHMGEDFKKDFVKPPDTSQQDAINRATQQNNDNEATLRLQESLKPVKREPDNSLTDNLRKKMALRMGMQSTVTGAGSLVAPTQQNTKLGA